MAEAKKTGSRIATVRKLIGAIEERIEKKEKGLIADYLRLIQLERELMKEEPKDVRLKWVDPDSTKGN